MPFVSVTRLRLVSIWQFPAFLITANAAATQARQSPGFIRGALGYETGRVFWTVTVWKSADQMLAYRNQGKHLAAMPKLLGWCDEASFVHWEQSGMQVPSPDEAHARLAQEGRLSKLHEPSDRHREGRTTSDVIPVWNRMLDARS